MIQTLLSIEMHQNWRSQVLKLFTKNGFGSYLTGNIPYLDRFIVNEEATTIENSLHGQWILTYQNLALVLYATMSSLILSYVLILSMCAKIWRTIEKQLQSNKRARILQIKNKFHNLSMAKN